MTWYPEIMYEDGTSSKIPFIMVPPAEQMPPFLFIFASRETGETEPGADGSDLPIVEMNLHQYADMAILKESLASDVFDQVRNALGLESVAAAAKKGEKITQSIRKNLE
jgi:hypothetical protein